MTNYPHDPVDALRRIPPSPDPVDTLGIDPSDWAWLQTIPTRELIQRGKLAQRSDPAALLDEVLRFFDVPTVEAWKELWPAPPLALGRSLTLPGQPGAVAAWLRLCELEAAQIPCQPFDEDRFEAALEATRALTVAPREVFLPEMVEGCASAGVAVVLVPKLRGAAVSGAAKWLTPRQALIGLNSRYTTDDRFWWAFFHAAGHLLGDDREETYIGFEGREDPWERFANQFAADLLIPPHRARELPQLTTHTAVYVFAKSLGIAPGLVVARLQRDGLIGPQQLNELKAPFD